MSSVAFLGPQNATKSLAAVASPPDLCNCFVLLPNYLSKCNALQLLRYNTTLNAFGKSEFHLVVIAIS